MSAYPLMLAMSLLISLTVSSCGKKEAQRAHLRPSDGGQSLNDSAQDADRAVDARQPGSDAAETQPNRDAAGSSRDAATKGDIHTLRVDNRRMQTIYLKGERAIGCATESGAPCHLFSSTCLRACDAVEPDSSCCVQCEPELPLALAVPGGTTRDIPFGGSVYLPQQGRCSECTCVSPAASGSFKAFIQVHDAVNCPTQGCQPEARHLLPGATPSGAFKKYEATFSLAGGAGDGVVTIVVD